MIKLYRNSNPELTIRPSAQDKRTKKLMGENVLSLTVNRSTPFEFKLGDYLFFAGERYTLNQLPKVDKDGKRFAYDLIFEGIEYELRKVHMLYYTETLGFPGGADFSLMGNAKTFMRVIAANMNRVQSGWSVGTVVDTNFKNITFSGESCLEAI